MPAYRYQKGDRPLDGYVIEYALGRGGFGEVYFALSDAGREVALKAVQNFEEIELRGISHCMNLKSPHLVMIFDVKHDADGDPWVIMEYVSGPSLREILDESPQGIGEEQAGYFLRELTKGMADLHDAGIVHRDLKPHNIFFEDGRVKIGDYSLSKAITTSHRSGHTTTVGSVHYMAPEIGLGRYDKTVDIYALGVILYEMLTGAPPYVGDSAGEVLMKHLSAQPDVSQLSEPFAKTVAKAMRRDPAERFQSVGEMMRSISVGDETAYSRPPVSLSMIGEREARRRGKNNDGPSALQETMATPVPLRDTRDDQDSMPFERPSGPGLKGLGLWWRRGALVPLASDPSPIYLRFPMAMVVCFLMIPFGCVTDSRGPWSWSNVMALTFLWAILGSALCWIYLSVLPRSDRFLSAIGTRILTVIPAGIATIFAGNLWSNRDFDQYLGLVIGLLMTQLFPDWRCYLAADRFPRVGMAKTMLVGGIAFLFAWMINQDFETTFLASALAMSLAMVVQIVAPQGRRLSASPPRSNPSSNQIDSHPAASLATSDLQDQALATQDSP